MRNGSVAARKPFVFRFEDIEVHEREFSVVKAGEVLPVEPKAFSLLLFLLRNPGRLVSKEELLDEVWGDAEVTEHSLTRTIAKLRRLLGDDIHEPHYIATVSKVGYRFVCEVDTFEDIPAGTETHRHQSSTLTGKSAGASASLYVLQGADAPALAGTAPQAVSTPVPAPIPSTRSSRWPLVVAGALLSLVLASGVWSLRHPLPSLHVSQYVQITHDGQRKALFGTDGTRLFFNRYPSEQPLAEVSIDGGEIAPISLALPGPWVYDVSPDGTTLLATSFDKGLGRLWSVGAAGNPLRLLADGDKGGIGAAAWSPDGTSVAYSTANGDLQVVRSDGSGARVLGTVPFRTASAMFEQISWSPDGRTIRFDRNNQIYEVSPDRPTPHLFLPDWHPSSWQCCGRWTPDGRFFLFLVWDNPLKAYPLFPPFQIWALHERRGVFRVDPSEPFQLTSGPIRWGRPVPAKDGKRIFARGIHLNGELVRLDLQSHQFEPYLGGISAEALSFSADGRNVAYVSFPEGILWKADRGGSGRIQLTDPPLYPVRPRWSPDGSQILFSASNADGAERSYVVSSQGGAPRPILQGYGQSQGDPNWSPDGRRIAFDSWEGEGAPKHVTRILDLASRQITTLPGNNWSPRLSPQGRFLAGLSEETSDLTLFDFETQRWSVLVKGEADFPTWSHDGQFIYFLRMSGDPGVYRIRTAGGQAERIADLKGFHHAGQVGFWMGLDPDDYPLLLRDLGGDDIYALSVEGK